MAAAYEDVARRLENFFDAYLKSDAASRRDLRSTDAPIAGSVWSFREALPAPPTAAQFDQVIEEQGVDTAVDLYRKLRARDPDLILFDETRLLRFVYAWGPDRSEDLMALLNLNLDAYAASADTRFWKAQILLMQENEKAARSELEQALALNPEHERARQLLDRLGTSRDVDPTSRD